MSVSRFYLHYIAGIFLETQRALLFALLWAVIASSVKSKEKQIALYIKLV